MTGGGSGLTLGPSPETLSRRRWLEFLTVLANRADPIAMRWFRSPDLAVDEKPGEGPVTRADRDIEQMVRELAAERDPGLGILGEETGETPGAAGARLIVDPIDATNNFVRGIPVFATLLAIEEAGEVVAGVASAPALRLRWVAARGLGATENGRSISVSPVKELAQAQIFHTGLDSLPVHLRAGLFRLADATRRQRGYGDFWQHLLVAAGRGEVAIDHDVKPWDVAALQVIVEEAGGRATDLAGNRSIASSSFVTSNGWVHDQALTVLAGR